MNIFFYYTPLHPPLSLPHTFSSFPPVSLGSFFPPSEYIWANCLLLIEAFTAFSVLLLLLRVEKNA